MSVPILKASLTPRHKRDIQKRLFFQPEASFVAKKIGASPPPIVFYTTDRDRVYLPSYAAREILGIDNRDRNYPSIDLEFKGKLLDKQVAVVEQAIELLDKHGNLLLHLPTGFGKTVIATYLACKSGLIPMVLLSFASLIPSWLETFKEFTNAIPWVVGEEAPEGFNAIICMERRCSKIPEQVKDSIGILIVDECHTFYTSGRVAPLLYSHPRHIIACSATPFSGTYSMLEALVGPYKVERKLDISFGVTIFRTGIAPNYSVTKQGYPKWSDINLSLAGNERRNRAIVDIVLLNPDRKILILSWMKDHANRLAQLLTEAGIEVAVMVGQAKTYSDSQVLIGTVGKIGTGFDEKMACPDFQGIRVNLLILSASTKSDKLLAQMSGRVFRSEMPDIVDIVDDLPLLERQLKKRLKWYRDNGATIIEAN
jgi:superfamily II DNA or RNA helicase